MAAALESPDIDLTSNEVFGSSDDEDQLMIDETSTSKKRKLSNGLECSDTEKSEAESSEEEGKETTEDGENVHNSSVESEQNDKSPARAASPSSVKPIQAVLKRRRSSHSTQTRYGTRTRSCSLPSKQSRYSPTENEIPFACDTNISLLDLASKLAAAEKKVNGRKSGEKRSPGKQTKPTPQVSKTMLASLKKKLQNLSTAYEETNKPTQLQIPANLVNSQALTNGTKENDVVQSPDMLNMKNCQVMKVDLLPGMQDKTTVPGGSPSKTNMGKYIPGSQLRAHKQNVKLKALEEEAKRRELEAVRELEEHRAREKEKSKQAAVFHAKALEFYNDALRVMNRLHNDPDDKDLQEMLPHSDGGLPLWPLLASTVSKAIPGSAFTTEIENAISETPERNRRKRTHAAASDSNVDSEDIPDKDCNVNSGDLNVPEYIDQIEEDATVCLGVNTAIRAKLPKFAKRSFEAAKYAAESGIKCIINAEEQRREREARGFGPPPRSNALNKQFINISPAPNATMPQQLIPVPVNLIPVHFAQLLRASNQPAQLKPVNSSMISTTPTGIKTSGAGQSSTSSASSPALSESQPSKSDSKRRFKCPECEYTTDNRSHLRRHVVTVHSDIKPFKCYVCEKEFARGEKCKYHMEKEHPETPYDPKKTKRQHVKLAEDGVQWPLDVSVVEENAPSPSNSTNNVENTDENTEDSDDVGNDMQASAMLKDIVRTSLKSNTEFSETSLTFPCRHCNYVGRDLGQLQKHISKMHSAIRLLKCGVCHYSTGRKPKMVTHMKKHGELFCFHCDFSTTIGSIFQVHLRICNAQFDNKSLECASCNKIYGTRKQLQTHMAELHSLEIFFCDMCSFSITDFHEFEKHTELHFSGDIDCQCMKCNTIFIKTEHLLDHAKDCAGNTSDNVKLKCPLCSFNTNQSSVLQEHLTSHINEKIIPCIMDGCSFQARWEFTIDQHMKLKHKIPSEPPKSKQPAADLKPKPKPQTPPVVTPQTSRPLTLQPVSIQQNKPQIVTSSATIIQSPLNFSGMAIPGIPIALPVSAVPIFSGPIPLQPVTMLQQAPQPQPNVAPLPTPKRRGRPPGSVNKQSQSAAQTLGANSSTQVYDEQSGGIKGHGSGMFLCPHCPDRLPFKYRRSYEKHMYKHQKAGSSNKPQSPTTKAPTVFKIKCPVKYCRVAFDTNEEVEVHLRSFHGVSALKTETKDQQEINAAGKFTIKNVPDPDPVVVESDDDEEEVKEEISQEADEVVTNATNGEPELVVKHENGDVEFDLDLNGENDNKDEESGGSSSEDSSSGDDSDSESGSEEAD